jgi:alpha-mannosidase
MPCEDLIILIPSHSLEDFPAELGDAEAASLLNAFAVAWHPLLLAEARILPRWHRADDPPDASQKRLVFVPKNAESWLPSGWAERVMAQGCTVVRGVHDREEMIAGALSALAGAPAVDAGLAADFLALGFCYLQVELLTRKMRHFSNLDEVHLRREAVAAADAAVAEDHETARARLQSCFDVLHEARERFYPVECFLLDLCLVIPKLADEHLERELARGAPLNLLVSAKDLATIAQERPRVIELLRSGCAEGRCDLICGDLAEQPLPLMPLNAVIWQLQESQELVQKIIGRRPVVWGRRRFGVFPQLPQLLSKCGFRAALHAVLDDGFYPDAEYSRLRWEGVDHTSIDAWSRIPLAADGATAYLRFPDRMSESMDHDHTAALTLARWPEVKSPFFEDLRRIQAYAPVLGRLATFAEFFERTETGTRHASYKPREYLTPYLFQAAAREEHSPIGRYGRLVQRRHLLDTGRWLAGMQALISGRAWQSEQQEMLEHELEQLPELPEEQAGCDMDQSLARNQAEQAAELAELIMDGAGDRPGYLVFNTLAFRRVVTVPLAANAAMPRTTGNRSWVQFDSRNRLLTLDVPGSGFAWVPAALPGPHGGEAGPPLAEAHRLQNEFFEVHINAETGGIAQIKGHGRSPNRLSQQLNYRFSRERSFRPPGAEEDIRSHYAQMRASAIEVTSAGPAMGEITCRGEVFDQQHSQQLAAFVQTVRVYRGRPIVELQIELALDRLPDAEPWHNYVASRFAWNDEAAALTYSSCFGAHEAPEERLESPYFVEIATEQERVTLCGMGRPFYRRSGPRMLDAILVTAREAERAFRFVIAIDQQFPMQAALDALVPALLVPTRNGPPKSGQAGWFFHLEARNVQILALLPPRVQPEGPAGQAFGSRGCVLRLAETEGRPARFRLRCFREPREAQLCDFLGQPISALSIDGDGVMIDMSAYEIADVALAWS